MKIIDKSILLQKLITQYPQAMEVLAKYDIDVCCHPNDSLEMAASAKGLDINRLVEEIKQKISQSRPVIDKRQITLQTKINQILEINPRAGKILAEFGLHCLGCHMALWETLADAVEAHNLSKKQIQTILKQLND